MKQNVDISSLMHTQLRDLRDSGLHGETNCSKEDGVALLINSSRMRITIVLY